MAKKNTNTTKCDVTVVIPVHKLDDLTTKLFTKALDSLVRQKVKPESVIVVCPSELVDEIESLTKTTKGLDITTVVNQGDTSFQAQINLGIEKSTTKWVSLLEYDDEMADYWLEVFSEYQSAHQDVDMFLPIVVEVDPEGKFIGLSNEAVWAQAFCEEMGIVDHNAIVAYPKFSIDGMIMTKSLFTDNGGFKRNIKLTFVQEFLLRQTYKAARVMVIPRFAYLHTNMRPGGLFDSYRNEINPNEANWWLSQAKKEMYFPNDREINIDKTD